MAARPGSRASRGCAPMPGPASVLSEPPRRKRASRGLAKASAPAPPARRRMTRPAPPRLPRGVLGEARGPGPAVALAHARPVAGVLLNAPYASVRRLFELRGPALPYRWLMSDPFDSEALIGGVGVPVMILHGTADMNVPGGEARRLYAAAREAKRIILIEGAGHLGAWEGGGEGPALAALAHWTTPAQ